MRQLAVYAPFAQLVRVSLYTLPYLFLAYILSSHSGIGQEETLCRGKAVLYISVQPGDVP